MSNFESDILAALPGQTPIEKFESLQVLAAAIMSLEAEKAELLEALKSLANAAMAGQQHTIGGSAWYDECYPGQSYAGELYAALDAAHAVLIRLNPLPDLAAEVEHPYHTQTA